MSPCDPGQATPLPWLPYPGPWVSPTPHPTMMLGGEKVSLNSDAYGVLVAGDSLMTLMALCGKRWQ